MVYLAAQLKLQGRPCVVKVARPELAKDEQFAARFEREKIALMSLRSRNTVQIIDYGRTEDGIDYIVMEFIEGEGLDRAIRTHGRFDQGRAISVALGICRSLEEAHGKGILHRDLKPANVMLVNLGTTELVKVIDFGIARLADSAEGDFRTRTGELPGTPAYASYEQLIGDVKTIDQRTDLYALGAIVYEMLTGFAPYGDTLQSTSFDSKTLYYLALAKAKADQQPTAPSELNPGSVIDKELDRLVLCMLESVPAKRPASAKEVRFILERLARKLQTPESMLEGDTLTQAGSYAAALHMPRTEEGMPASPVADLANTGVADMTLQTYEDTAGPRPPSTGTMQGIPANRALKWTAVGVAAFLVLAVGIAGALFLTGSLKLGPSAADAFAPVVDVAAQERPDSDPAADMVAPNTESALAIKAAEEKRSGSSWPSWWYR